MILARPIRLFVAYAAVLAPGAAGWIRVAGHAVPSSFSSFPADERLIVWVLAWVAHALRTAPRHVFDANIYYPASGQLAGSEHFATSQLVFAPLFWATGNPVLAAGITAMLSYPLAAFVMNRLLVLLGCGAAAAWVGGLVLALGPLTVPGNLHVLQYAGVFLPAVALGLTRLRERPALRRAVALGLTLLAAVFSSYYMAVLAGVTGGVWGALELARPGPRRARFAVGALVAATAALGLLAVTSMPYFESPGGGMATPPVSPWANLAVAQAYLSGTAVLFALASPGLLALASHGPASLTARRGLVISLVALAMLLGPAWRLSDDVLVPLPFALLTASVGGFFRFPFRFVVMLGFGIALLSAAAVQALASRRPRSAPLAAVLLTTVVLLTRGRAVVGDRLDEIGGPWLDVYTAVGEAADRLGRGPLLELPVVDPVSDRGLLGTQPDAMVGSTRHWLPLVGGFTGHPPPHWPLVTRTVARLPRSDALDDLVDLTHVRWILLRPRATWPQPAVGDAVAVLPGLTLTLARDGYRLLRVERAPRHPEWFPAIAQGPHAGATLLGIPLTAIPEGRAGATVTVVSQIPAPVAPGGWMGLDLRVTDDGEAPWPVTVLPGAGDAYVVHLLARWWRAGEAQEDSRAALTTPVDLPRDVAAGETLLVQAILRAPAEPGRYVLEVGARQIDGARFDGAGNHPLRLDLRVGSE